MTFTGRLLVATPVIADPNFERTVVLILAHSDEGALGVILNRPSLTAVAEVVEEWAPYAAEPGMMFIGGPVGQNAVVGLGLGRAMQDGIQPVVGPLGTVDLNEPPEPGDGGGVTVRLFAGSAGWASGQLEDELAEGAWWLMDAAPEDPLTSQPDELWAQVLRRQGTTVSWFANHPDDPTTN